MCQIVYLIAQTCPARGCMLLEVNTQEIYTLVDANYKLPLWVSTYFVPKLLCDLSWSFLSKVLCYESQVHNPISYPSNPINYATHVMFFDLIWLQFNYHHLMMEWIYGEIMNKNFHSFLLVSISSSKSLVLSVFWQTGCNQLQFFLYLLLNHLIRRICECQIYYRLSGAAAVVTGFYAVWLEWCGLMEVDWCHIVPGGSLAEGQGGRSQRRPACYTGAQRCCQPAPLPPSPRATRG